MVTKTDKQKIIQDLKEKFDQSSSYLIVNILNLDSISQNKLRNLLKENGGLFQVAKKTLIYKANPNFPFKDEELKVPFALVWNFTNDLKPFSIIKKLKEEGLQIEILKGYLWQKVFSQKEIEEIISLPSKEELMTKLVTFLKGKVFQLDFVLSFPLRRLISVMSQIKK